MAFLDRLRGGDRFAQLRGAVQAGMVTPDHLKSIAADMVASRGAPVNEANIATALQYLQGGAMGNMSRDPAATENEIADAAVAGDTANTGPAGAGASRNAVPGTAVAPAAAPQPASVGTQPGAPIEADAAPAQVSAGNSRLTFGVPADASTMPISDALTFGDNPRTPLDPSADTVGEFIGRSLSDTGQAVVDYLGNPAPSAAGPGVLQQTPDALRDDMAATQEMLATQLTNAVEGPREVRQEAVEAISNETIPELERRAFEQDRDAATAWGAGSMDAAAQAAIPDPARPTLQNDPVAWLIDRATTEYVPGPPAATPQSGPAVGDAPAQPTAPSNASDAGTGDLRDADVTPRVQPNAPVQPSAEAGEQPRVQSSTVQPSFSDGDFRPIPNMEDPITGAQYGIIDGAPVIMHGPNDVQRLSEEQFERQTGMSVNDAIRLSTDAYRLVSATGA